MTMLRRHTELLRRTVTQTPRVIVPPESGAPDVVERHVRLEIPEGTLVYAALGPRPPHVATNPALGTLHGVDDAGALPEDIAEGRLYQWPMLAAGAELELTIRADQWITAATEQGTSEVTVIVEYLA